MGDAGLESWRQRVQGCLASRDYDLTLPQLYLRMGCMLSFVLSAYHRSSHPVNTKSVKASQAFLFVLYSQTTRL